jgi:hypothetical protein
MRHDPPKFSNAPRWRAPAAASGEFVLFPARTPAAADFFGICSMTSSRDIPAFRASKSGAWAGPGPVFPPGEFAENELPSETH